MLIAQRPTLAEETITESRSRFVIEPLEPGFGYTLGNSLRRTLLSSIPGAAVTSIRLDGVLHEFSTIAGVKEDVTEIILNIKRLVVSSEHDEPVVAYLSRQGAGTVTAADITAPAGVEIHNPELVLATLNDSAKLQLELTIERGRGYVSAAQNRDEFVETALRHISFRPGGARVFHIGAGKMGGKHDALDWGATVLELADEINSAHAGQRNVNQRQLGLRFL